jgi:hypothetical protein
MHNPERYPFISADATLGEAGFRPSLPIKLIYQQQFKPVQLVFAWTRATNVPLLLGQVNFFMEFDVCFYCSQLSFEVSPKTQELE